jgi:glycine dehydrogenase subunit 1
MPFIPHTDTTIRTMLAAIGAPDIDALFEKSRPSFAHRGCLACRQAMTEMEIGRHMHELAGPRWSSV